MIPKMNKYHLDVVSGAILATIRKCDLYRTEDTVAGVWSETAEYETYSPSDRLWVRLIRGWEKDSRVADKAYIRVRNIILKKWKEQDQWKQAWGK